jgi:hypothetical protein
LFCPLDTKAMVWVKFEEELLNNLLSYPSSLNSSKLFFAFIS